MTRVHLSILHESLEGLLYLELKKDGTSWKAYFGRRLGNTATLDQVIGPGTAKLELLLCQTRKLKLDTKAVALTWGNL